jgi:hypothetical protein
MTVASLSIGFDDLGDVPKTRAERLRVLGYEEIDAGDGIRPRSAEWLYFEWEQTSTGMLLPAVTPLERRFKLAGLSLFLQGLYPSGRAIKRDLGYDVSGKVKLNGRECRWKAELFLTLHIEPFWWRKAYRDDYSYLGPDWLPYWRRGPRGSLQRIVYRKVVTQ